MKAAYFEEAGGPDKIKVGELPDPDPGSDQVLVRNHAAGVGPWDWKIAEGRFYPLTSPHIPGFEAAGVVEKAPDGSGFSAGDEVWGRVVGAFAELVVSDGESLVPKPANVSFAEAAALVVAGTTAYEGLVDRLKLQAGETVLVVNAAGGVGSGAVQVATAFGARVIGVAGPDNLDYVRSLGADDVTDYHDAAWPDRVRELVPGGVDVVFDAIGSETGTQALKAVRDNGRGAFVAFPNPDWEAVGRGITGVSFSASAPKALMEALTRLIADGKLKAPVIKTMPLDQAGQALEENKKGHTRGKIVLTI